MAYAPAPYIVFKTDPEEFKICKVTNDFNISLVTVSVSPDVITVPVTSGRVIVLSAVGSATVRVVSLASSVLPSNTSVPFCVNDKLENDDAPDPVINPENAVAVTVPFTCKAVDGVVVPIPTLLSEPSIVITVVVLPPSLTLNVKSVSEIIFENITPVVSTLTDKSLSTPIVNPVSFTIPSVPEVVSFCVDLKKPVEAIPPSASASVAVPLNLLLANAVDSVIPFLIVANPVKDIFGVNSVADITATNISLFYRYVTFCD